ncbi:MAG: alpha/beta hydrolase [Rhodospirillales bacterium]
MMRRFAPGAALILVILTGACAPVEIPPGAGQQQPALNQSSLISFDGTALPLRRWLPEVDRPDAVILALHGFNDYANAFSTPAPWFTQQNLAVFAIDQRGFGDAPGRGYWHSETALTGDVAAALDLLGQRYPGIPLYLMGVSMGGAVALASLTDPRVSRAVQGTILLAPAIWGASTQPWWQRGGLWLFAHTIPWMRPTGQGLGIQASDNIEMLRGLGRDPKVIKKTRIDAVYGLVRLMDSALLASRGLKTPALVLYGAKDEVIPPKPTRQMLRNLPPDTAERRRIAVYPEGWHMLLRDLQGEVVWRDIASWIRRPEDPLPSGAEAYTKTFMTRD